MVILWPASFDEKREDKVSENIFCACVWLFQIITLLKDEANSH